MRNSSLPKRLAIQREKSQQQSANVKISFSTNNFPFAKSHIFVHTLLDMFKKIVNLY